MLYLRKTYVVIITASLFICGCSIQRSKELKIVNGIADLSKIDLSSTDIMAINGEWEFYNKKLLTPASIVQNSPDCFFYVPGLWNGRDCSGEIVQGQGYATLRVVINHVQTGKRYGLLIKEAGTAYTLWANGVCIAKNGIVGINRESMRPQFLPQVVFFTPEIDSISLILNISNFYDNSGGPWHALYFGDAASILKERIIRIFMDVFLIGAMFIMGLYHLGLYALRRKDRASLAFSILCLIFSIRTALMGERLLIYFFPEFNWEIALKIEHITAYVGVPVFVQFMYFFIKGHASKKFLHSIQIVLLSFAIAAIILPAWAHTKLVNPSQVIIIITCLYLLYILVRMAFLKSSEAYILLGGFSLLTMTVLNDILYDHSFIHTGYYVSFGLFGFFFAQAFLLSMRFARAFSDNEHLTDVLRMERDAIEVKVEERTSELALVNEKLKELDRVKTNFFANVSHELRTPLTLILSPIESILQGQYAKEPDSGFFEGLYVHGARLLRLINNLLDFSKIEAGRMTLNRENADIDRLLSLYVSSMRSGAESRGLVVNYENNTGDVYAEIDTGLFENAMYNLLSNAVKFTPSGGSITVILEADDDIVSITVTDSGIGIPDNKHEVIFERFAQADEAIARKYEGTGIGLSLTKEVALMHGGNVTVQSSEGKGSAFTLTLPRTSGPNGAESAGTAAAPVNPARWQHIAEGPAARSARTGGASSGGKEHRVLIVEDNNDMLAFLKDLFSEDYEVLTARNGREALGLLKSSDELPDIVVSDVMMPEMDGLELVEKLRCETCCEAIPILLLTARTDVPDRLEGFDRGATDYISKPFNARELLARANAQIQLKLVRDRLARINEKLYARLKAVTGEGEQPVSESAEQKVAAVMDFIKENFDADISREGMAAAVGLSADHLSRVFNRVTGKKIPEYINELRVIKARSLLRETTNTITEIAMTVGFDTVKNFNRVFKNITGMTPGAYRGLAN